jgi:hypothetical protein
MAASSNTQTRARASIMPRTLGQNVRLRKPSCGGLQHLFLGDDTVRQQLHQD